MLFNGETYDYIGSQRMVYDMLHGKFPVVTSDTENPVPAIALDDISLYIELNQLSNSGNVFVHFKNDDLKVTQRNCWRHLLVAHAN